MASVDDTVMRAKLQALLKDGAMTSSVAKLRQALEQALDLQSGALDAHKDQVNRLLREELLRVVEEKKRKAAPRPGEVVPAKKPTPAESRGEQEDKQGKGENRESSCNEVKVEPKEVEGQTQESRQSGSQVVKVEFKDENVKKGESKQISDQDKKAKERDQVSALALSGGEDGQLRLWDLKDCSCVRIMEGHVGTIRALAVDWEHMMALSGADDDVRLWSLNDGECQKRFAEVKQGCSAVAVNWDGKKVLGGCGDGKLRLWSMDTGELTNSVSAHPEGVWTLQANWRGQRVASGGDEDFKIWDIEEWMVLQKVEVYSDGIMSLALDWDGSRALVGVGSSELSLRLWDLESRKPRQLLGHLNAVAHIVADWEEDLALTAGWDAQLRLWNLEKGSCGTCHECAFGRIRSMAADLAKMRALCGSSRGSLHAIDLRTGAELHMMEGHEGGVTAVEAQL